MHEEIGWNARLSAMQAALGKSQLLRMEEVTAEKRRIGLAYQKILSDHRHVQMQPSTTSYSENKYWVVGVVLNESYDVREIAKRLRERGVDTRPFFHPLHRQPLLASYSLSDQRQLPVSERLGSQGIYLPSFVGLSDAEITQCAEALLVALEEY